MRKLFIVLTGCLSFHCFSQNTSTPAFPYKLGEPYRVFDFDDKFYFSKANESLSVKLIRSHTLIQKFDNEKASCTKATNYEDFFPGGFKIENMLEVDGKYYFFFSIREDGKDQLSVVEINWENGTFIGNPKPILTLDGKVVAKKKDKVFEGSTSSDDNKFDFSTSYDKKRLLIEYCKIPEVSSDKKSYSNIGLYEFDKDLNVVSKKEIRMPYTESRMENLDYQIDGKGNIYMLEKVFHDDSKELKKSKSDVANYHIELFTVKAGTDNIAISKFENSEKFISSLQIFNTAKDYMICGGLYCSGKNLSTGSRWLQQDGSDFDNSDGIVVFKFTPDGNIYDQYYYDIPLDIINAYENKKTRETNDKKELSGIGAKIPYLQLRNLEIMPDGGILVVGEESHVVYVSTGPNGGSNATPVFGSILAARIDSKGALAWMKKIPKQQGNGQGVGTKSFKYFNAHNNHYFVFMDAKKNLDLAIDQEPIESGIDLAVVRIDDADAKMQKGYALSIRNFENMNLYKFGIDRAFKTSEDSFMVESYKKDKEDIMIKVTLD